MSAGLRPFLCLALVLATTTWVNASEPSPFDKGVCWQDLSEGLGTQNTGQALVNPTIDATSRDDIWMAWSEGRNIQIRHWNGNSWQSIPGPIGGSLGAHDPVVRLSRKGSISLAWRASDNSQSNIYIASWNGEEWDNLGKPLSAYPEDFTNANSAALAIDTGGNPVVAWQEANGIGPRSLHAAKWNGDSWTMLGNALTTGSDIYSLEPSLSITEDNTIWISWNGGNKSKSYIRVSKWTGSSWQDVGNTETEILHRKYKVRTPSLEDLGEGHLLLVWLERGSEKSTLELSLWTGMKWEEINSPPRIDGSINEPWFPSLAIMKGGVPLLGWSERDSSGFSSIYVNMLEGRLWRPLLSKMQLDAGQSDVDQIRIAAGQSNTFFVAWDEPDDSGNRLRIIQCYPCQENEIPVSPPQQRPLESFWPKTVDEAVYEIVSSMDEESKEKIRSVSRDDLIQFHLGWGMGLRNRFGLWRGNTSLLESCGGLDTHPDSCSMTIIESVWEALQ